MSDFKPYRRKQIAELRPWQPGDDMAGISVSAPDREAGSPKAGDMIARNPQNHADQWLVAAQYFADNFEPSSPSDSTTLEEEMRKLAGRTHDVDDHVTIHLAADALAEQREEIGRLREAVIEECAAKIDSKAELYRAYADRAARSGDPHIEAKMQGYADTTEDDARSIRALKAKVE